MRFVEEETMKAIDVALSESSQQDTVQGNAASMTQTSPTSLKLEYSGYPAVFFHALEEAIQNARENSTDGALVILSIENLAMVMSGYGHEISEQMMQQIYDEVQDIIGKSDQMHRIQRDQFGIILNGANQQESEYICDRIVSHIRQFSCYSQFGLLHVLAAISVVCFPEKALNAEEALDKIFIAMHEGDGGSASYHDDTEHEPIEDASAQNRQEMGLANYLNKAIQEKRLRMAYQPIICAKTGEVAHYEALLRMHSDDGKLSSAGALIPIAERMGLIDVIDDMVLHMVVEELRRHDKVRMAFNVSNLTTQNSKWLETLSKLIAETPDIASRMVVEITETAAQRDLRRTAFFVAEIQAMGVQVALDDFGSGYTSFRQLKTLSVDMVKIDGAFVKDLVDNADNRFFVKTLLDFTNGFGLKSVAEYVETGEIAKMLMELGVEYLQGYYFGRPETHRSWLDAGEYSNS